MYATTPEDLNRIKFRNDKGEMVPFNAIFSTDWSFGPAVLQRYNAMPALEFQGEPRPGIASGIAMAAMEEEVRKLGNDFGMEWTGLSYQEKNGRKPDCHAVCAFGAGGFPGSGRPV